MASATEARAHGVMLNMVVSLLRRLGNSALGHTALGPVIYQLLDHSTSPSTIATQHSDHLLTDGMTLWYSVLKSVGTAGGPATLTQPLLEMMQRLPQVMASNREPCKGLLILEAYVMLGGAAFMQAHADAVCAVVGQFIINRAQVTAQPLLRPSLRRRHRPRAAPRLKLRTLASLTFGSTRRRRWSLPRQSSTTCSS
eukprot:SAG11_NODE_1448_length_4887_cov_2.165831_7_plen_197_part_00